MRDKAVYGDASRTPLLQTCLSLFGTPSFADHVHILSESKTRTFPLKAELSCTLQCDDIMSANLGALTVSPPRILKRVVEAKT